MDDAVVAAVERRVGLRRALHRERVRGEGREWKLCKQCPCRLEPPEPIPPDGPGADRRDLAASNLETPTVEIGAEWKRDRLRTVPRRDDRDALRREQPKALAERFRIPRRLDDVV